MDRDYYRIKECLGLSDKIFQSGTINRGAQLGFKCMEDMFSVPLGYPLYMYAHPHAGKTTFKYEMLMTFSEFYGWKHVLFDCETGNRNEITRKLIEVKAGGDLHKHWNNQITEQQYFEAQTWVNEHFIIVDPGDRMYKLDEFYEEVDRVEDDLGEKIHTFSGDPFNAFKHAKGRMMHDEYLNETLLKHRAQCKSRQRLGIMVVHCRDQQLITDKASGMQFYPPPTPRDIQWGQEWFRLGMMMLSIWQPPSLPGNETEWNERQISIDKRKPEGVASPYCKDFRARLYYDVKRKRYYELDEITGEKLFAFDYLRKQTKSITPNEDFDSELF